MASTSDAPDTTTFERLVREEEAYLRKVHPKVEDIPTCMSILESWINCNSAGPHLKSMYRYGHMAKCGPKMEEFKFCLSTKWMHPEERREAWITRRAEWWAKKRISKSSENVWEARTEPFKGWPPAPTELDELEDLQC